MDAGEWSIIPLPFQKEGIRADVPFHNSIIDKSMVYQDRLETKLLQLFAH